jgi:hypothetical protein
MFSLFLEEGQIQDNCLLNFVEVDQIHLVLVTTQLNILNIKEFCLHQDFH